MQSNRPQPSAATSPNATPGHLSPLGFTYWQEEELRLGYLDEFPDRLTQGESLADLKAHLLSLYMDPVTKLRSR